MLYEVAIIERPTKKQQDEGKSELLVFGPKAICAGSAQTAAIMVSREINLEKVNPDLLEVFVRPFAPK